MYNVPRIKPLIKGVLSFPFLKFRTSSLAADVLGTGHAECCYSIFLRYISLLNNGGVTAVPKTVAELGPGSSLGVGFAALIAGAEKYYALDIIDHTDVDVNLSVFDELVALFRRKAPIPAAGLESRRFPDLDCYDFPSFLISDWDAARERRIAIILDDIASKGGVFVETAAPWTQSNLIKPQSVDWIFSVVVLQHVDDVAHTYRAFAQWLKPGGYASHTIGFDSHNLTKEWNGHWAVSDLAWQALRGRRPYLLNRLPYGEHLRLAAENGFSTVMEKRHKRFDGLINEQFAPRFRTMSDDDARTEMVFLISRLAEKSGDRVALSMQEGRQRE
ncbi:methyltransferase domain-containing protein [Dankookia rubra]|uniref:Methyltransferase domain-containing protein n=1 Tax=Dankookia rubra TaxID=1442381 RepID=A0A4R5QNC8_9PROT|nr:methyltransferase domain-containing protein [Dankookia rubra]TDH64237.1 methyltransferase domain-containing protein [Dankookia rubra]